MIYLTILTENGCAVRYKYETMQEALYHFQIVIDKSLKTKSNNIVTIMEKSKLRHRFSSYSDES